MAHWHYFVAILCYGIAMLAVGVGSSESARRSLKTIETASSSDRISSPYAPTTATQLLQGGSPTLFVGTIDGRIAALDWRTGQEKWSYATKPSPVHASDAPSASIPTSTDSSTAGTLGEGTHWEGLVRHMMFASSSPAIVPGTDGLIYFNTPGGLARHPLSAADITRHSPFMPPHAHANGAEEPSAQQPSSVVYLGQKRTSFHALHPDFGLLKTFTGLHAEEAMMIEDEVYLGGIGARDIVHVSRNDYCVAAVDLATGRELWNVTGGEFVIENYANISSDRSGPLGRDNGDYTHFLVSSSTKATLKLIDIRTGEQVWKSRLSAPAIQAFAKGEKLLFFTEEQLLTLTAPAKKGQSGASDGTGGAVFVAVYNHTHYALPSRGLREKLTLCFRKMRRESTVPMSDGTAGRDYLARLYLKLREKWWSYSDEELAELRHSDPGHPIDLALDHHRRPRRLITPGDSSTSSTAVAIYSTHDGFFRSDESASSAYPLLPLEPGSDQQLTDPSHDYALFQPDPRLCAFDSDYYAHCVFGLHLSIDQDLRSDGDPLLLLDSDSDSDTGSATNYTENTTIENASVRPLESGDDLSDANHFARLSEDVASFFFLTGSGLLALSPLTAVSLIICLVYLFSLVVLSERGRALFKSVIGSFGSDASSVKGSEVISVVVVEDQKPVVVKDGNASGGLDNDSKISLQSKQTAKETPKKELTKKQKKQLKKSRQALKKSVEIEAKEEVSEMKPIAIEEKTENSASNGSALPVSKVQVVDGIEVHLDEVLGNGSKGTIVFAGTFQGRKVAVKRMLAHHHETAQREIELLIDSDEHPALIRYYAKAVTDEFIYLVLSHCPQSLVDFVNACQLQQREEKEKLEKERGEVKRPQLESSTNASTTAPTVTSAILNSSNGANINNSKAVDSPSKWITQAKPTRKGSQTPENSANWRSNKQQQPGGAKLATNNNSASKLKQSDSLEYAPVINLFYAWEKSAMSASNGSEKQSSSNGSLRSSEGESSEACDLIDAGEARNLELKRIIYDLAQGLRHLHGLGIIHRDIKPQNILIDADGNVKITDMGLAKKLDTGSSSFSCTVSGTPGWIAPELLKGEYDDERAEMPAAEEGPEHIEGHLQPQQRQRGTKQVDLFSLGCVIYYILTCGRHPYGETHYEREWRIARGEATGLSLQALHGDDCALQLVRRCLEMKPENRIGLKELLHHPYFWNHATKLNFILAFSDKLNIVKEYWEDKALLEQFNGEARQHSLAAVGKDWSLGLEKEFLVDFSRFYKYKVDLASDLLRFIRNKSLHYREAPVTLKQKLSGQSDVENSNVARDFVRYFLVRRFPLLLMACYQFAQKHFHEDPALSGFVNYETDS